jgi:hypothetical protein
MLSHAYSFTAQLRRALKHKPLGGPNYSQHKETWIEPFLERRGVIRIREFGASRAGKGEAGGGGGEVAAKHKHRRTPG